MINYFGKIKGGLLNYIFSWISMFIIIIILSMWLHGYSKPEGWPLKPDFMKWIFHKIKTIIFLFFQNIQIKCLY